MMRIEEGHLPGQHHSTIPYTFFRHDSRHKLCIVFPGLGYTAQRPLLHYPTGLCIENGHDVLLVNHTYKDNAAFRELDEAGRNAWLQADGEAILSLLGETYTHITMISKSIGSIPMAHLALHHLPEATRIWLTPLLPQDDVQQAITSKQSFAVISKEDPFFREDIWKARANAKFFMKHKKAGRKVLLFYQTS
jgi:hypothetical protein